MSATSESAAARPASMIVGGTSEIIGLRRLVRQVAPSEVSVLLTGPSGSGKDIFARAIHAQSRRAVRPFVAVNCGAIPRALLESVLFGHEKGSFPGAHAQHKGWFEEADGGTLFLDGIGDMPAEMQMKLLRVLEERAVQRVGGCGHVTVDVRIVAATHRDIDAAIDTGSFREDLFYRLAVFPIDIPALAERQGDVPLLIAHFLDRAGAGPEGAKFSPRALARLAEHGWPGNVRELRNLVERANIIFGGRTIGARAADALLLRRSSPRDVAPVEVREASRVKGAPSAVVPIRAGLAVAEIPGAVFRPIVLRRALAEIERRYIEEALVLSQGVVADAARLLSLQRTTLVEKIRKYELGTARSRCLPACPAPNSSTTMSNGAHPAPLRMPRVGPAIGT
jgi:sigma-54 specific flagellar transcriptional regulator A